MGEIRDWGKTICPLHLDCVPAGASVPPHFQVSSGAEWSLAPASQSEQSAFVWSLSQSALELPAKFIYRHNKFSKHPLWGLDCLRYFLKSLVTCIDLRLVSSIFWPSCWAWKDSFSWVSLISTIFNMSLSLRRFSASDWKGNIIRLN